MKEEYLEPELDVVCFASMQRLALDLEGGGDQTPASDGYEGDLDWIIP